MADNKPETPKGAETLEGEMSEAEIDQTLKDSFPASDPPSWTLGSNHVEDSHSKSQDKPDDVERGADD